jgi:hypothetical protein
MLPRVNPVIRFFFQTIPEEIVDRVPIELRDRADEIIGEVQANPALLAILIGVGVLSALLFVWGVVKQFFKAAFFAALASAGAWYWYFNIR